MLREVGGYALEAKLGEGGMGAVYRASHPRFPGREFAVKVLLGDRKPAPSQVDRFARELDALSASTEHPGIVKILGGSLEGTPFIVMELVKGVSLDKLASGGMDPERAARILRAVADAVAFVHGQGVIHRDLKPQNILVEAGDRPRVCDFGLAKIAEAERLTRSGTYMGTPAFSAPEQLDGRSHLANERADVYGLGAVLYYVLTGRPTFLGSGGEVTRQVLLERPKAASKVREGVPAALDAVCAKALEKLPIHRYSSAAAFRDDLDRFLRNEPVLARAPGAVTRVVRAVRARKGLAAVVAALVLALIGTAGALVAAELRAREHARRLRGLVARLLAPGPGLDELEKGLSELPRGSDEAAAVELRRDEAKLAETLRAGKLEAIAPQPLLDLARSAARMLEKRPDLAAVSLVGEREDLPALGLLLLERRRIDVVPEEARERLREEREKLLAAARALAGVAIGPARQALSARVVLAAHGAPFEALGPGHLVAVTAETLQAVKPDLEAASALPGKAGAAAAWLLADLLVVRNDPGAGAAIERAARLAPGEEQAILEASLRDDRDPAAALVELAPRAADPAVAKRLSRFLARKGLPSLLEAPELAATPTRAAVLAFLASEDPPAFEPRPRGERRTPPELHERIEALRTELRIADKFGQGEDQAADPATKALGESMRKAWLEHGDEYEKALARAIDFDPEDNLLWSRAADENRFRLTTVVWRVEAARRDAESVYALAWSFSAAQRAATRIATGTEWYFPEEVWETGNEQPGAAACRAFDERLSRDMAEDPTFRALASHAPGSVQLAVDAARGLRRLEECEEHPGLPGNDVLAAEALVGVERFAELARAAALPYRARARRLVFPERLGEALASLDLHRMLALVPRLPVTEDYANEYAVLGLSVALERAAPEGLDVTGELRKAAVQAIHFYALRRALIAKAGGESAAETHGALERELSKWREHYDLHRFLGGLRRTPREQWIESTKPSADDEDLLRRLGSPEALDKRR